MAIYETSYIGTAANRVAFNDFDSGTPIFRVISRAPQQRAIRDLDIPIPFENGISDFKTLTGKYAYVIEGVMYPGGEAEYDQGIRKLRKVGSLEISQDDAASDEGYVPYVWTEAEGTKQVFMKVLYVDIREDTRKGLVQPFRLICKIKDPTIFGTTLKLASTESVDPTESGGGGLLPATLPLIFGSSTYSVSANALNQGDLPTYPQAITIYGPVLNPILENETTSKYIQVNTQLATAANVLRISYDKDTLRVEKDGVSVIESVTAGSEYFKLEPGSNALTLNGSSVSSGAYVEVAYYDAWPLS